MLYLTNLDCARRFGMKHLVESSDETRHCARTSTVGTRTTVATTPAPPINTPQGKQQNRERKQHSDRNDLVPVHFRHLASSLKLA